MAASLKKGIGAKYLLPIVTAYVVAATTLMADRAEPLRSVLQHIGVAGLAGFALLVFQDLVPRPAKEVLVFWRLRERPPGYRAFSRIAPNDARVNPTDLAVLLPAKPLTPAEQNATWYRWLKSVEDDAGIADNHQRFLALRDCAVLLVLLSAMSICGGLLMRGTLRAGLVLASGCFIAYLPTALAARNAAARLVGNVIARKVATS